MLQHSSMDDLLTFNIDVLSPAINLYNSQFLLSVKYGIYVFYVNKSTVCQYWWLHLVIQKCVVGKSSHSLTAFIGLGDYKCMRYFNYQKRLLQTVLQSYILVLNVTDRHTDRRTDGQTDRQRDMLFDVY